MGGVGRGGCAGFAAVLGVTGTDWEQALDTNLGIWLDSGMKNSEAFEQLTTEGIPAWFIEKHSGLKADGITAGMKASDEAIERVRNKWAKHAATEEAARQQRDNFDAEAAGLTMADTAEQAEARRNAEANSPTATGKLTGQSAAERKRIAESNRWIEDHNEE